MPPEPQQSKRWFFGPIPDLLLGCGVLYFGLFAAQAAVGPELRAALPLTLLPLLTLLLGAPHYGATLLRVYEDRESRHRYFLFGAHATGILAVVYVAGLHITWVGSLLVTLYLTWSPWHYSGQNYGVAVLFLSRRGIKLANLERRLLHGCFSFSYLMVFLAIHSPTDSPGYAPAAYRGTVFDFLSLGIPTSVLLPAAVVVALAWLACVVGFLWVIVPRVSFADLLPSALLILAQALWFAVPTLAIQWGIFQSLEPLRYEQRAYAFMWVAVGHFLQYLWITTWYAAAAEPATGRLRYLGKTLLAGAALWVAPTLLFAPGVLGPLSHGMGLALLTASVVNIHHFVLDGVIWKLRDGFVSRRLLRRPESLPPAIEPPRRRWLPAAIWTLGGICFAISLGLKLDVMAGEAAFARGDVARLRQVYDRRAWLGRDNPAVQARFARIALRNGDLPRARADATRSNALRPNAEAEVLLGRIAEQEGDPAAARAHYTAALALDPENPAARKRSRALAPGP